MEARPVLVCCLLFTGTPICLEIAIGISALDIGIDAFLCPEFEERDHGVPVAFGTKNNAKAESWTTINLQYLPAWLCSSEKPLDASVSKYLD